jgi:hypothetical protein
VGAACESVTAANFALAMRACPLVRNFAECGAGVECESCCWCARQVQKAARWWANWACMLLTDL